MFYAAATWPDCKTARRGMAQLVSDAASSRVRQGRGGGKKVAKVLPTLNSGAARKEDDSRNSGVE